MIFALTLLAVQTAIPPSTPDPEEVVVIGNRLKAWLGAFKPHGGKLICQTKKSTGDGAVDALGCEAVMTCLSPIAPQIDAVTDGPGNRADRERALTALVQTKVPCMAEARRVGIARLAAERRPS